MPDMKQIIFVSVLVCALLSTAAAQDSITAPKTTLTITANANGDRVRVTAPSSVVQLHLEVYAASGEKLFDQEIRGGNVFDWHLQDGQAQRLVAGDYVCVVTAKTISGKLTQKIGTVTVAEKSAGVRAGDSQQLTSPQAQAIGPVEADSSWTVVTDDENKTATVIANTGTEGQMIRGRGALTFRLGDFFSGKDAEQMRLTEEGNLGIGTSTPQARLDVAGAIRAERFLMAKPTRNGSDQTAGATTTIDSTDSVQPLTGGTGTTGQLAKWTDGANGTLGDSVVTESSGNLGIGTTAPGATLEAYKPAGANVNGGGLLVSRFNDGAGTFRGGSIYSRFIGGSVSDDALVFGVTSTGMKNPYADFDQARMTILAKGQVGIGTITPGAPLEAFKSAGANVNGGGLLVSRFNDGAGTFRGGAIYSRYIGGTVNDDALLFGVTSTGTKNPYTDFDQARMAIFANGNVGIGTTNPISKLDVDGDINTSTQYNIGGNRVLSVSGVGTFANSNTVGGVGAGTSLAPDTNGFGEVNSFFGNLAGQSSTTGSFNSFFGYSAGQFNTTGASNSFFGFAAGQANTASFNSFFGNEAGFHNGVGNENSFFGWDAGGENRSGSLNTMIGFESGDSNQSGSNNTIIGAFADTASSNLHNATALGFAAQVGCNDCLVLGSISSIYGATANTSVGIGTTAPLFRLHVVDPGAAGLRVQTNTGGGAVASFGGNGDFQIDAPSVIGGRLIVEEGGNVGIGTPSPDAKLSVNGTADKVGGGSWATFSDERLKNIKGRYTAGLKAVMQLQPLRYEYKRDNALNLRSEGEHIGFSAQAVQKLIPEAVTKDDKGFLLVDNDPILWTMLNAIKEQQAQLEQQQTLIKQEQANARQDQKQIAALQAANAAMNAHLRAIESLMRKQSARRR